MVVTTKLPIGVEMHQGPPQLQAFSKISIPGDGRAVVRLDLLV